jgi:hypothetical protein
MLTPILQGARYWPVPSDLERSAGQSHFAQRAVERGVSSVSGAVLFWLVDQALACHREDLLAPVFTLDCHSALYRILLPEGPFYPVIRMARPVTIYTQNQVRAVRHARRLRLRQYGQRQRRSA